MAIYKIYKCMEDKIIYEYMTKLKAEIKEKNDFVNAIETKLIEGEKAKEQVMILKNKLEEYERKEKTQEEK